MISKHHLSSITKFIVPKRYQFVIKEDGLIVRRLLNPEKTVGVQIEPYRTRGDHCKRIIVNTQEEESFIIEFGYYKDQYDDGITGKIRCQKPIIDNNTLKLEKPRYIDTLPSVDISNLYQEIHNSWKKGIYYKSEILNEDGETVQKGLRQPQAGALHATSSHWTLSNKPALIVMPTGTGKTEVMIATTIASFCKRVLVVVPTDPLRQQTADKYDIYGILEDIGIIEDIPYPIVGILTSKLSQTHNNFLKKCNVVVTTMSSIGRADDSIQRDFADLFSHIFFDEAHHIEASTWKRFKHFCNDSKIVLFTATPFREDGKPIDGKIIYNYPLSKAQELGYFRQIQFKEVFQPDEDKADREIADKAVDQLRTDLAFGYSHILMARAKTIDEAKRLYKNIYAQYSDLNPTLIHSQIKNKKNILESIRKLQHRIIVCVDMFGEGYDLPNLKIAALHDVHKSIGITLQFIGRFTRRESSVGDATFVANSADDGVPEALESLYWEDADWNDIISGLSYDTINPKVKLSDLVNNLESVYSDDEAIEISILALRPKISAQVYSTSEFYPRRFKEAFRPNQNILQPQISRQDNFLVLIVNQKEGIDWTDSRDIAIDSWDLYLAYYNNDNNLLFIHSSRKGDSTTKLAKSISKDPQLVHGEDTFKTFSGLKRLTLHNVGLSSLSRNVRYQMFAGLDVRSAIEPVVQHSKRKSNITGVGYEDGQRKSIGCSYKGKVWSVRSGTLADWMMWCDNIGEKLSDPNRNPDDFLQYTLIPENVTEFPNIRAIMADWPDQLFESFNFRFEVLTPDKSYEFDECQIDLLEWNKGGKSYNFKLLAGDSIDVKLQLKLVDGEDSEGSYIVEHIEGQYPEIKTATGRMPIVDYFMQSPPLVRLEDGSQLSGNILLKPHQEMVEYYERDKINVIEWSGTDITVESRWRGSQYRRNSVQQKFIEYLETTDVDFIYDDDDTGESADIVTIKESDDKIQVHLWHCKFSSGIEPGHRVSDLYEVCGQAQKGVKWSWNLKRFIKHLMNRETKYKGERPTRFIRGTLGELITLRKSARRKFINYKIGIVQPGLSKSDATNAQLAILGATSSFINCVTDSPLIVFGSE